MARPKKEIDEDLLLKLSAINCSYSEMAQVLDCDESTLTRRFAHVIKKGRAHMCMSLKRKQYDVAMSGNVTMLIWLGKITLKQVEVKAVVMDADVKTDDAGDSKELAELKALHKELLKDRKSK